MKASFLVLVAMFTIAAAPTARPQCTRFDQGRITAGDGADWDAFGYSMSLDGPVMLVGAPWDSNVFYIEGAAYVYRWTGGSWMEEAKLTYIDGGYYNYYGYSRMGRAVALDGNRAAVGAPGMDGYTGIVYAFEWDGTQWVGAGRITPTGASHGYGDGFGWDLSMDGQFLAIACYACDLAYPDTGSIYVFRHDGTQWIQDAELTGSDLLPTDGGGVFVTLRDDLLVAGFPNHQHPGAERVNDCETADT